MKFRLTIAALLVSALGIATVQAEMRENLLEQPDEIKVGNVGCFQNGIEILSAKNRSFDSLWVSGNSEIVRFEMNGMVTYMASQDSLACVISYERRPTDE